MNLKRNGLAIALSAVVGLGASGQAAADVYGLGYLDLDNLNIDFFNGDGSPNPGAINFFTFSTGAEATLNGTSDPVDGAASCNIGGGCGGPGAPTVLSGTVQNAPPAAVAVRGENDFTKFMQVGEYSNAESTIHDAQVIGDASSSTEQIAEGNITTGTSAQANTVVNSNTSLAFTFTGAGSMNVNFDAIIDVLAEVTGGDLGLAQANSGISLSLTAGGTTLASWAPDGVSGTFAVCAVGLVCVDTEAATNLNNALSSPGAAVQVAGGGNYNFNVSGLSSSQSYGLALNSTTSIDLAKVQPVPEPGTLFLLGAGLLGVGMSRRKKHAAA